MLTSLVRFYLSWSKRIRQKLVRMFLNLGNFTKFLGLYHKSAKTDHIPMPAAPDDLVGHQVHLYVHAIHMYSVLAQVLGN